MRDYVIIGGGIVGLATAMAVRNRYPRATILVLEKEHDLLDIRPAETAASSTPAFITKPGSLKARFGREGNRSMIEFCRSTAST